MVKKRSLAERQASKAVGLVTGVVGLNVASGVGSGLSGSAGKVVNQGVLPVAGMGLLGEAAPKKKKGKQKYSTHEDQVKMFGY